MVDELKVEETTASSSEENKPAEVAEVSQDKSVPYNRFKEVVDQRNQYRELLNMQQEMLGVEKTTKTTVEQVQDLEQKTGENYGDALKIIDSRVEEGVSKKVEAISRQMDLDRTINKHSDFFQYADLIKSKIKDNPHLSWADAYKLSRYEAQEQQLFAAKEEGKKEAYKKIEEKKAAVVESATKTKVSGGIEDINPLAKGADGKFLFTTKELEDILPKK